MSPRLLTGLNTAGLVALGALTLVQWRDNTALRGRADAALRRAEHTRTELAAREATLVTAKADLEDFRTRLTRADAALADTGKALATASRRADIAADQVETLKTSVTGWHDAVTARDTRLTEYATVLKAEQAAHAEAVERHNALISASNETVTRLNALTRALGEEAAPVRLTAAAIPAPATLTAPGAARRDLTPEEIAKILARLTGAEGIAYAKPVIAAPADTLVEGDGLRLLLAPDGTARFERPDLRVFLPAPAAK